MSNFLNYHLKNKKTIQAKLWYENYFSQNFLIKVLNLLA